MLHTINEYQEDFTVAAAENLSEDSKATDPKEEMANHVAVLKIYARRVLEDQELLEPWEEIDKSVRVIEFFALGSSFECTHRELVKVLYKDLSRAAIR